MNTSVDQLKKRHRFADCFYWSLFILVPIITACVAIATESTFWMVAYLLLSVVVFFVVVYKFFCTHCPHYIEGSGSLKCMFFWGVPKYFKAQPGPYTALELMATAASLVVWVAFPLPWLQAYGGLLAIYVLSLVLLVFTLRRYECGQCTHFHCPGNKVSEEERHRYAEALSRSKAE